MTYLCNYAIKTTVKPLIFSVLIKCVNLVQADIKIHFIFIFNAQYYVVFSLNNTSSKCVCLFDGV